MLLHLAEEGQRMAPESDAMFAVTYLRTERGEVLDYSDRPYLLPIMRDQCPEQVVVANAQSGKTLQYLGKMFNYMQHPKGKPSRTAIYTFPTSSDVEKFASARAKVMLQANVLMRECMGTLDNATVKQFKNFSTVYFGGTWTDRAAISIPCDLLVHDELDRSKPDTLVIYGDRLGNSDDPRRWLFSTPTVPSFGISAEWEFTDKKEWVWQCPACGEEQIFAPMDKQTKWQEHLDFDRRVFHCLKCGAPVGKEVIAAGAWVPMVTDVQTERSGYHITSILRPNLNPARVCRTYEEAQFPHLWVQGQIGIPEVESDSELTADMIQYGDWRNVETLPPDFSGETVAGLDQGKFLDLMVGDGKGHILAILRLETWRQVEQKMEEFRTGCLVCDMYPETRPVQDLIAKFPSRVWMADYSLQKPTSDSFFEREPGEERVRCNRTGALDFGAYRIKRGKFMGDVFPVLDPTLRKEFEKQICAPQRTTELDKQNQPKGVWIETGPDHFRHSHAYYVVALMLRGRIPDMPEVWKTANQQGMVEGAVNVATGRVEPVQSKTLSMLQEPTGLPQVNPGMDERLLQMYPALRKK